MEFNNTHISIKVNDLERSLKFYNELLEIPILVNVDSFQGIEDVNGNRMGVGDRVVLLEGIELTQKTPEELKSKTEDKVLSHFGVKVKNIEKTVDKLEKRGIKPLVPVTYITWKGSDRAIKVYFFKDPDGNALELVEWVK